MASCFEIVDEEYIEELKGKSNEMYGILEKRNCKTTTHCFAQRTKEFWVAMENETLLPQRVKELNDATAIA